MIPIVGFRFQNLSLYRMRRLSRDLGSRAEAVLGEDQEIHLHDWRILAVVHDYPGITGTKAGPLVLLNKMQVSRSTNRLCELGLLTMSSSEADGRTAPLHLTGQGQTIFEVASRRMVALEIWALAELTSSELELLGKLLDKIETRVAKSQKPDATLLDDVYASAGRQNRAAYLFRDRGDAYDASNP